MIKTNLKPETAFIDLLKPENLSRIKIDKELVPAFFGVMQRMQDFFVKKGLIYANNYAMLFEKYLLTKDQNQYAIVFNNEYFKNRENVGGTYDRKRQAIVINKQLVEKLDQEYTEYVLCHEFIHFITLTTLPYIRVANGEYKQFKDYYQDSVLGEGGFFVEAYTDMLTEEIYFESNGYRMLKMLAKQYNFVTRAQGDYFSFLRGRFPGKEFDSAILQTFRLSCELFFDSNKRDDIKSQLYDENFKQAQEMLSLHFLNVVTDEIEKFKFSSVESFIERLYGFYDIMKNDNEILTNIIKNLSLFFSEKYYENLSRKEIEKNAFKIYDTALNYEKYLKPGFIQSKKLVINGQNLNLDIYTYKYNIQFRDENNVLLHSIDLIKKDFQDQKITHVINEYFLGKDMVLSVREDRNNLGIKISLNNVENVLSDTVMNYNNAYIYLDTEQATNKRYKVLERRRDVVDGLNAKIGHQTKILSSILRLNKNTVTVMQVDGIDGLKAKEKIYLGFDETNIVKFYYLNNGRVQKLKNMSDNSVQLILKDNKPWTIKVSGDGRIFSCIGVRENSANIKDLKLIEKYMASDQRMDMIVEKENYKNLLVRHIKDFEM